MLKKLNFPLHSIVLEIFLANNFDLVLEILEKCQNF
jgi:hypothetical protein